MDPEVVAALIGAVATIIAAAIAANQVFKRKTAERASAETETAITKLGSTRSLETPYTLEKYIVCASFDDEGNGEISKTWIGVRVRNPQTKLGILFSGFVDSPEGRLLRPRASELPDSPLTVTLSDELTISGGHVVGKAILNGAITPEMRKVSFIIHQPTSNPYCLTREEAERAYKDAEIGLEYASASVTVPTDTMEIRVEFPRSHWGIAKPKPLVFIGEEETVHNAETAQVAENVKFENGTAVFTKVNPVVGLTYAVTWMPPRGDAKPVAAAGDR